MRSGHPNDALKCFQLGQFSLREIQAGKATPATLPADDPRIPTLAASLNRGSAAAYALMDGLTSVIQLDLGQLDTAEQFAASAVHTYGDTHLRRARTRAELTLAEVHVRAGEPRGLVLARQAIEAVSSLQSVAVRQERLVPLATALEARPGNDAKGTARMARQVVAMRV